jgi:meso-butanediol dehydrogenase / (S,S)-butanediol dehydrogenase / diacetyl reductase
MITPGAGRCCSDFCAGTRVCVTVVNKAGVHEGGDPAKITDEQWRKVMATDADGVFFGCRDAIPHLEKTKGLMVNTASVSGMSGDWAMSPYNAKGSVVNLTRALARDLGKTGICVNSVLSKLAERIPLGRVCDPRKSRR